MQYRIKNIKDRKQLNEAQLKLKRTVLWPFFLCCLVVFIGYISAQQSNIIIKESLLNLFWLSVVILILLVFLAPMYRYCKFSNLRSAADRLEKRLQADRRSSSVEYLIRRIKKLERRKGFNRHHILQRVYDTGLESIKESCRRLLRRKALEKLENKIAYTEKKITQILDKKIAEHPLTKAANEIDTAIFSLKRKKVSIQSQWNEAYANFSWWQKMTVRPPDFASINRALGNLENIKRDFHYNHKQDFEKLNSGQIILNSRASERLKLAEDKALEIIDIHLESDSSDIYSEFEKRQDSLLNFGLVGAGLGLSASLATDLYEAHDVYDALREVNGNFADMSDTEIWWECLWLDSTSFEGLMSLTKGACFEQLVAADTGGMLFEHFNHPGTDIVIDGAEVQLKATDSVEYINSVDPDTLVMATSEVAAKTDAIDSGISNADITETTGDALGGTVFDFSDALSGALGGLGLFASIRGVSRTMKQVRAEIGKEQAFVEGVEVAVVYTLKGLVDAGELVYKVTTSKPIAIPAKFAWKGIVGTAKYIDKKMEEKAKS